jgi:phenylpropionate dioxygenase-like ring-hydroxylating dioxygenase large terminal subunit
LSGISDTTRRLVNEVERDLEHGLLPMRIFNDADVHADERDRVFTRAWVFLGHESEIPAHGDYVQRYIAGDAFILVRGEDGVVRVLFDSCRHRGALVCRADRGNASHFRCPYHGWTYKNTGEMAGAPFFKPAYGGSLEREHWGLHQAPRVESFHGFVFASLDPDAPSLDEYLGPMRWYLDAIWGPARDGWEVIGDPQRFLVPADWKAAADNFSGDDYHTFYLHRSTVETGVMETPEGTDPSAYFNGYHVQAGNGHNLSCFLLPEPVDGPPGLLGFPRELCSGGAIDAEVFDFARRLIGCVGNVFPNFSFLSFPFTQARDHPAVSTMTVRVWQPVAAGELEVWTWALCPRGASAELRERSYRTTMGTFSAGGVLEQDDAEPWIGLARAARSGFARKIGMKLNYQMGLGEAGVARRVEDFPGGGVAYFPVFEEGVHRGFHRRWAQFMRSDAYPSAMTAEQQDGRGAPVHG